jgi:hypothetical protein
LKKSNKLAKGARYGSQNIIKGIIPAKLLITEKSLVLIGIKSASKKKASKGIIARGNANAWVVNNNPVASNIDIMPKTMFRKR